MKNYLRLDLSILIGGFFILPICVIQSANLIFKQSFWVNNSLLSTLNSGMGLIAIITALIITVQIIHNQISMKHIWSVCALLSIGVLSIFAATMVLSKVYYWIFTASVLISSFFYMMYITSENLAKIKYKKSFVSVTFVFILVLGFCLISYEDYFFRLNIHKFNTFFFKALLFLSGFIFLLTSIIFFQNYNRKGEKEFYILSIHTLLLSSSLFSLININTWDSSFWAFQFFYSLSFMFTIVYLYMNYMNFVNEIKRINVQLYQEVDEREKVENRLEKFTVELKKAADDKDEFITIMKDDVKEKMENIERETVLLMEENHGVLGEEVKDRLSKILHFTKKVVSTLESVFIKANNTKALALPATNINQVLTTILKCKKDELRDANVKLSIPQTLEAIPCESRAIGEIYYHLINNAIKYNDKKEKWIEIGQQKIKNKPDSYITIFYVRDDGIGIRKERLNKLFLSPISSSYNRNQSESDTSTVPGLVICRHNVEQHNGKIWAESTFGEGTTIYFTLEKGI